MKKAQLNTVHLPMVCIGSAHLNTIGYPSGSKSSGGVVPPEPGEENAWLWGGWLYRPLGRWNDGIN